ncbi:MAG: VWA domain-containing protein [Nanoarchaeota archaeon]|nr:VWA domain-containing protein [Nanoarchaeota archaeon]
MELKKRGVFFSIDSLIALAVLITGIILIVPLTNNAEQDLFIQSDIVVALSSLKIGEIDNSYVDGLISSGKIEDLNKSVLEQIAEFYVTNKTIARELSVSIFENINTGENFGIWFGNELIASKNTTKFSDAKKVIVERQVISGIREGESVTAFSGRAFLSGGGSNEYFYFGGYVGEGNLTALLEYEGNITSVEIELAIADNFELYVNGNFEGNFVGSGSEFTPVNYIINTTNFSSGINTIEFKGDNLNIAGGFIRLSYTPEISYNRTQKYYFPGIDGVINFYGSFYVPNPLKSMNIHLRYFSNLSTFLNIGNVTVYNGSSESEVNITLSNSTLASLLDYNALTGETIPVRFGVDADFVINVTLEADVFSVTDLSGSMNELEKIDAVKASNKVFTDAILSIEGNRVGLIGFQGEVVEEYFHNLSSDNVSLNAVIDLWDGNGQTCICCGINRAVNEIVATSGPGKLQTMVVMSDGGATQTCPEQNTGSSDEDAILAACQAYQNHGIIVYAVGFGNIKPPEEATLQSIASCGYGNYYYGSVSGLLDIYEEIADEIISASFFEQTAVVTGNFVSKLFADSYIDFEYDEVSIPFGLVTTSEKGFDDIYSGTFGIPLNSTIIETRVISYSGQKWTDTVYINGTPIYNLSKYGDKYLDYGDPYSINIPNSYVGSYNVVNLTTGLKPGNSSGGSINNKIIYTISQDNIAAYSSLSFSAEGCNWELEFEDLSTLSVSIPSSYNGLDSCFYTSLGQNITDTEDAFQVAVNRLLELLDFDKDGLIDVGFSAQDLGISSTEITGIPFDWSTEMQVRTWY